MKQAAGAACDAPASIIDLYQLHFPDPDTPIADTLGPLNDLESEGKVRENRLLEFFRGADSVGEATCATVQPVW